ncbi:MAG: hypothetical protein KatS3mg126_2439 [Lysobacteraceae bacterium]|nr:MAG: hypothetical protein KatS3mg126_2439 [Xanthomonadaceae bacterium]
MRICFPNGEHRDVAIGDGGVSLGADRDNDVILEAEGIRPRHATITRDPRRGILLHVSAGASVHVNGREVREFAMLRLGDVIHLGRATLLLKPERDEVIRVEVPDASAPHPADPVSRAAASRVVLRGVSGGFFGRSLALQSRVVVGSGKACLDRARGRRAAGRGGGLRGPRRPRRAAGSRHRRMAWWSTA